MPPVADVPGADVPSRPARAGTVILVLLALAAAGGGAVWLSRAEVEGPAAPAFPVHVLAPQPTTFYRWFDAPGVVVPGRDQTLGFRAAGKVQDVLAPGATFSGGETVARLQGAAAREKIVNDLRTRVAYLQQMLETARAQEGKQAEARQAEARLTEKRARLAEAHASLAQLEIRPDAAGAIAEVLVKPGGAVQAGTPAVRLRSSGPRVEIPLSAADAERARALSFCRVETIAGSGGGPGGRGGGTEIAARPIDCSFPAAAVPGAGAKGLTVDLQSSAAVAAGAQVRLASGRYDGVFPVPRSAVGRDAAGAHLWVLSAAGVATMRPVEVADTVGQLALVNRGLRVGDTVIVDPPAGLGDGARVEIAR
jgi:multidrug efflux system membrane fusion protein